MKFWHAPYHDFNLKDFNTPSDFDVQLSQEMSYGTYKVFLRKIRVFAESRGLVCVGWRNLIRLEGSRLYDGFQYMSNRMTGETLDKYMPVIFTLETQYGQYVLDMHFDELFRFEKSSRYKNTRICLPSLPELLHIEHQGCVQRGMKNAARLRKLLECTLLYGNFVRGVS